MHNCWMRFTRTSRTCSTRSSPCARFGASYEQLEVVLNILLVGSEAMKLAGAEPDVIDEALQAQIYLYGNPIGIHHTNYL